MGNDTYRAGVLSDLPGNDSRNPLIFGKEHSRAVIGVQMASSYVAVLAMPPLFWLIASNLSVGLLPLYLAGALVVFVLMQRRLSRLQLEP